METYTDTAGDEKSSFDFKGSLMRLGTGRAQFRHKEERGMVVVGAPSEILKYLVPEARLELAQGCPYRILSPARLPFHHSGITGKSVA